MKLEHHAYLIEGDWENLGDNLVEKIEGSFGVTKVGNPDFYVINEDSFGIDDARALKNSASRKSLHPTGIKIFLLSFLSITTAAQNALLKLLEEPTNDTHFFILTPSVSLLLPTLISRVESLTLAAQPEETEIDVKKFLKADVAERLNTIAPLIETRDKRATYKFCASLESSITSRDPRSIEFLERLNKMEGFLSDTSPSTKMILENIALTAPNE